MFADSEEFRCLKPWEVTVKQSGLTADDKVYFFGPLEYLEDTQGNRAYWDKATQSWIAVDHRASNHKQESQ